MNNLSPSEIAQLCLDSVEDARPYLNRDVIIALREMVGEQGYNNAEQALEIAEIALKAADLLDDGLATAWAVWSKGIALSHSQYYRKAIPFYRQAEVVFKDQRQWLPLVRLQAGLVYVLTRSGEPENALTLAREARPRCALLGHDGLKALGTLEMNVGISYKLQGQLDLALQANEQAMQAYVQLEEEFEVACIKINSANVCMDMDNYGQAKILYNEAGQILKRVAPEQLELSIIDFNLGLLAERLGHYQKALHYLERARDGFMSEAHIALVDMNRARIYNMLNLNQEALTLTLDVSLIYKQADILNDFALALLAQAKAWRGLGQLEMADHCLQKARQLFITANSQWHMVLVDITLVELALENQDIEQARQLIKRLLSIVNGDLWPNLAGEAYLLQAQILLWTDQKEIRPTKRDIQNAYAALQQAQYFTEGHPQPKIMVGIYHFFSHLYIIQEKNQAAWSAQCKAIAYLEDMRANLLLDEFQIGLMDAQHTVYLDGVRLLQNFRLFDVLPDEQTQWTVLLYLLNMAATAPLVKTHKNINPASDLDRHLQTLRASWNRQQNELEKILSAGNITSDTIRQDILKKKNKIAETESQISDLSRRMEVRSGRQTINSSLPPQTNLTCSSDDLSDDILTFQFQEQATQFRNEIQKELASHEILLYYFTLDEQAYLLLTDCADIRSYSLGPVASIQRLLRSWRTHLQNKRLIIDDPHLANRQAYSLLSTLGRMLIEPIMDQLASKSHLYLVYPPEWHEIPFVALRMAKGYLVEQFQLTHLSTPEALIQTNTSNDTPDVQPQPNAANPKPHALIFGLSESDTLPQNLHEARQVEQTLRQSGWQTTLHLEKCATLSNFYTAASQCRLVHLATHAFFQPENPLFSWVRLADSQLTVADIYRQTVLLNQALVVLSACETGRGRERGGGLLGMARALLVSGAHSLVVSLWKVEDQATAQLMEYFYEQINNPHTPITSYHLCQAQKRMATTQHPFFWAGFIYIGG